MKAFRFVRSLELSVLQFFFDLILVSVFTVLLMVLLFWGELKMYMTYVVFGS